MNKHFLLIFEIFLQSEYIRNEIIYIMKIQTRYIFLDDYILT